MFVLECTGDLTSRFSTFHHLCSKFNGILRCLIAIFSHYWEALEKHQRNMLLYFSRSKQNMGIMQEILNWDREKIAMRNFNFDDLLLHV